MGRSGLRTDAGCFAVGWDVSLGQACGQHIVLWRVHEVGDQHQLCLGSAVSGPFPQIMMGHDNLGVGRNIGHRGVLYTDVVSAGRIQLFTENRGAHR